MKKITIDCAVIDSRAAFHQAFAEAFSFPEWYGNNLDALYDCLTDISEETGLYLLHWDTLESILGNYALGAKKAALHAASENQKLNIVFE